MNNFSDLYDKTLCTMNKRWKDYPEKYTEKMILSKKMPEYFDFYDYSNDFKNVYEPSEDTFLMIDCLSLEKFEILKNFKNKIVTFEKDKFDNSLKFTFNSSEVGCGSGLVSCCLISMIMALNENENSSSHSEMSLNLFQIFFKHYCIDVNQDCLNLSENLFKNYKFDLNARFIESNLFQYFKDNSIKLDLIIFNPPYVTTDEDEFEQAKLKKDISASWAGGKTGSEVTFEFIIQLEVCILLNKFLNIFSIFSM